ncbi:MAG TPA: hypothetical protein VIS74_03565, partial [Chthoniobacterales bacterium]
NIGINGLAPVFEPNNPDLVPVWHPWPGESVNLAISRPEAIAGATVTVNRASHEITLGKRQRLSKLDLSVQSSLGEDFLVELPAAAEITAVRLNQQALPVRKDGPRVIIPLRPGSQNVAIDWKMDTPLGFRTAAEAVRLPVESANVNTTLRLPDDRWVLWTFGPLRGPAVQFWVVLACSLIAAGLLGRLRHSPLNPFQWMLLALGLTQVPLPAAIVIIGWLFFTQWRGRDSFQRLPGWGYNLFQLFFAGLTVAAAGVFIAVVAAGLLGDPEMFIRGNGSSYTALKWYQARSGVDLPTPVCFSVSIWWYRLLMLVWALWLAASLIRWLAWAWRQFGAGGYLRKSPPKVVLPPRVPPGA